MARTPDPKGSPQEFHIVLIKPSKYDDDGYVIRWAFGIVISNSLACLYGLTRDVVDKGVLGAGVRVVVHAIDEGEKKVDVQKIILKIRRAGARAVVCLVGVQSNQYPRALDLAMAFRKEGLPCMIGGFRVSGCLSVLPQIPKEIQQAIDAGITVVAGEVENEWGNLLKAAYEGRLEPVYNFLEAKPDLAGAPGPIIPVEGMSHVINRQGSFDAGRGCPFKCSFCTIINVQGNRMRSRTADDIEKLVRMQYPRGVNHFFVTDDNFSRHKDWEAIADRLIELKEKHGMRLSLKIQVDTAAYKIPRFVEKMARAGVRRVFIGMESVNPRNLKAVGKHHNQIAEYRKMLQTWMNHGVLTFAGYMIGLPDDTYESVMADVEYLKRELPLEFAQFFIATPLPGSMDHLQLLQKGVPMEEDLNLYETTHVCVDHPKMTREELMRAYHDAWESFYSDAHLRTLLLRRKGPRRRILCSSLLWICANARVAKIHPFLGGIFRMKDRQQRRPGRPVEPFLSYYANRIKDLLIYTVNLLGMILLLERFRREANRPENAGYVDAAIRPDDGPSAATLQTATLSGHSRT
ncbi:MAG: radical SAM protein [Candidatus Omnitrophota bacterium]|jgi:hypothetical protein